MIHHLAVDGVSWRILLEDLRRVYGQLGVGGEVGLPAKTSSYQQWAAGLREYGASGRAEAEAGYWREQPWERASRLPRDYEGGSNRRGEVVEAVVGLSVEETRRLLQEAPGAYRTRIQELLLAGLAGVLAEWSGGEWVVVEMEGHGREEVVGGVEVTRTVGWFTSVYPVLMRVRRGEGVGERIKRIKEQVREVPEGGVAYGVVRYLCGEGGEGLAEAGAEVVFNYLGQLDQVLGAGKGAGEELVVGVAGESRGESEDPEAERQHVLEINGAVVGGQLGFRWSYSAGQYEAGTIERVAERYRQELIAIIEHCREECAGGRTPSDFPLLKLNQQQLDKVIAKALKTTEP